MKESQKAQQGEEHRKRMREERERTQSGEGERFILMCTQSEGSLSAIVPGLSVKTLWLPLPLFISVPFHIARTQACASARGATERSQ